MYMIQDSDQKYLIKQVMKEIKVLPYNSTLLPSSSGRLLFTFAKRPTSGGESNYKIVPILIKEKASDD